MSYNDLFTNIFSLLYNDATLVPGILGARVPQNLRIMRASPHAQQVLSTYEPNQPAEGWLVIEEPAGFMRQQNQNLSTNHEFIDITFHAYGTTYTVTHEALDVTDRYFHWSVEQQRDVQWGDRFLLFTRRVQEADVYDQPRKLYSKDILYAMEFVLVEDPP